MPASYNAIQTPFMDPQTGQISWTWLKLLQQWQTQLAKGFDSNGNLISNLDPSIGLVGRTGNLGSILQYISAGGIVESVGLPAATAIAQGAVILPAGAVGNTLGTAALASAAAFDAAGSSSAAQGSAELYAQGVAQAAQQNAETFASNATNLTTGTVPLERLSGISVTIATASLTPTGAQGSMTFKHGLLTAQTQAT